MTGPRRRDPARGAALLAVIFLAVGAGAGVLLVLGFLLVLLAGGR